MVVYDLICSRGHRFEGWFKDLEDLENQTAKKLLICPVCSDENISRRPSTFGVVKTGRQPAPPEQVPAGEPDAFSERLGELVRRWEDLSTKLDRDFVDVGSDFAEEALKMHYGAAERRNIKGVSTEIQEDMLRKEGVDFFKFPALSRKSTTSTSN